MPTSDAPAVTADTDEPRVLVERRDRLLVITLNRPGKCNAVDPSMTRLIEHAVDELEADPDLRVGIVRARMRAVDPVFCAGHDLKHYRETLGTPEEEAVSTARGGFAGLTERERRKPLIAAVGGLAAAGGCEIALACDIVIASRIASFAMSEVRWNHIASGGGALRIPRVCGRYVSADMLLTGQAIGAERAYQIGLVSRLTEPEDLDGEASRTAAAIVANAPRAVELSRHIAAVADDIDDKTGWRLMRNALSELRASEDLREGLAAFEQRRPARWTGR
jgi:enoyl-CoA hydratase